MMSRLTSIVLAVALGLTGCRGTPPASPPPAAASPSGSATVEAGLVAYLPPAGAPAGWTRSKPPQTYSADTLWEFIDGAAETYVGFGFQEALSAGYAHGGSDVGIEIYQMADPLRAFGIYTQERPPAPPAVQAGVEGYVNSNVLVFWKGASYVKLIAARPDQPGLAAMTSLARAISDKIPDGGPLPRELTSFPQGNLVPHSIKFVPKDILGQQYFTNGFEATYLGGQAASRLIVIPCATPADAASSVKRYRAFVGEGGRTRAPSPTIADEAFAGTDRFSGRVVVARAGAVVAISIGASSDAAASALISEFLRARRQDKS
jgi:hypothetical protein